MCVILAAKTNRISPAALKIATEVNPDGNGLAWLQDGVVHFEKNITRRRAQQLAATVPMPYVFHARIATVGGVRAELCHPFPMDRRFSPTTLDGKTKRGVLFHNGHWGDWQDYVETDETPWSDSRAMAALAALVGVDYIEEVVPDSQRVALLTPAGLQVLGHGWVELERGVLASNRCGFWTYRAPAPAPKKTVIDWERIAARVDVAGNRQTRMF